MAKLRVNRLRIFGIRQFNAPERKRVGEPGSATAKPASAGAVVPVPPGDHFFPSARFRAKNVPSNAAHSGASTPPSTVQRWFSRGSVVI